MITKISFQNYKVLRDTSIELGPYNVVIGPNGSGKSTLLNALSIGGHGRVRAESVRSIGVSSSRSQRINITIAYLHQGKSVELKWEEDPSGNLAVFATDRTVAVPSTVWQELRSVSLYALDERAVAMPVELQPHTQLAPDGRGLAGVLDRMRDVAPEQFDALNEEVSRLLPEFDRILFETPGNGQRALMLRTRAGHPIRAVNLSQGTLLALALLTIAYLPDPPSLIGIEEPDRGIHPRLYRDIQAALYRLAYPASFGITRKPVQVIVTTHSPFLLDLHRDTPEEIIIAEKTADGAEFHRLTDRPELAAILDDVSLGEAWYSGVLGGVPAGT